MTNPFCKLFGHKLFYKTLPVGQDDSLVVWVRLCKRKNCEYVGDPQS